MKTSVFVIPLLVAAVVMIRDRGGSAESPAPVSPLRTPASFAHISDDGTRARALFVEVARVLQHPRCSNCHPSGDRPLQGDDGQLHQPMVVRGAGGLGAPGMRCSTCHASENVELSGGVSVPGHSNWHLAPREMAWSGRSVSEICEQIKDPSRNGGKDLEALVHHMAEDGLVGWAWHPGTGREPAPGSQEELARLTRAWVDAGAACPGGEG